MKVLVLGLPRTGTQSIADALAQLGLSPIYHMREVSRNNHQDLWAQALEAKFESKGEEQPWGRQAFEQMLAGFEVRLATQPPRLPSTEETAAR